MTTINLANIPNSITSVEELITYCILILRETAPNQAIVESLGVTQFQADVQESVTPDGTPILVGRFVLLCQPPSAILGKAWNKVLPIPRSADIPSYYLSN